MPVDLSEDHPYQLFSTNHQAFSFSSSLSYSLLFNLDQDQGGSCTWETKHLQSDEEDEKIVPFSGSWNHLAAKKNEINRSDLKLRVWKKEDGCENLQAKDSSTKWMPSNMRMMWRMMVSDQKGFDIVGVSNFKQIKYEEKNSPLSPLGIDGSNYISSSSHNNIIVRIYADSRTTKTPL
ncbi:GATA transcription factor 22 [Spatholobus suberectus]|nr:GATA transcription factor 22 [Spatholobus suberectus]